MPPESAAVEKGSCLWRIADSGEISNSPHTGARHSEHAFGRSYRARICRPARKARWARASLGSVLLLFCPALLHRFRELLPACSSEPATSLGRRGLTGRLAHTPLCPASLHRLGQTTSPRCRDTATPPFGRTRSSSRTADHHLRILEKGVNSAAYFVAFRFQLCDYPVCGELLILGKSVIRHTQGQSWRTFLRNQA